MINLACLVIRYIVMIGEKVVVASWPLSLLPFPVRDQRLTFTTSV